MADGMAVSRARERRPPPVATLSSRPGRPRAAREIVDSMQGDIAGGRLPLGSRLPNERDLARHYGVSQPTVREAVRALDVMGLVDVRHGSGVYVTGDISSYLASSLQTLLQVERVGILQVMDLRALLGTYSARQAAQLATPADLAALRSFHEAAQALGDELTPREMVAAPMSFQLTVSAAARNPLLFAIESVLLKVVVQVQLSVWGERGATFWRERILAFGSARAELLGCIAAHDGDGAVRAIGAYFGSQRELFSSEEELSGFGVADPLELARALDEVLDVPDLRPPQ